MGINRTKLRTPPSTTLALQAWSRVAHLSFHATLWFCFVVFVLNCVVPIVARQVSRPKVKKKEQKKEESESASEGKSKERPLFQSTSCRQVLGQLVGKNGISAGDLQAFSTKSACACKVVNPRYFLPRGGSSVTRPVHRCTSQLRPNSVVGLTVRSVCRQF